MAASPGGLRYSREHEWVRLEQDGTAVVGITEFAQGQLGDVIYLTLPQPGERVQQFARVGEVESVKAVSDLFSPIGGEVLEVNAGLEEHPELVNQDPYGQGWLLRLRVTDPGEVANLLSPQEYDGLLAAQG